MLDEQKLPASLILLFNYWDWVIAAVMQLSLWTHNTNYALYTFMLSSKRFTNMKKKKSTYFMFQRGGWGYDFMTVLYMNKQL